MMEENFLKQLTEGKTIKPGGPKMLGDMTVKSSLPTPPQATSNTSGDKKAPANDKK